MTSKQEILNLLSLYNTQFPAEEIRTQLFSDYLHATDGAQLIDRKNFGGHITTSAFIIDAAQSEMLLLKHKSLGRWLQPGGHAEAADATLIASALREAVEETGMSREQLNYYPVHEETEVPFDIDSHYIPANPKKEEAGHYHHDHRYVFLYNGDRDNQYNPDESTGLRWVPFADLAGDDTFAAMVAKIKTLVTHT